MKAEIHPKLHPVVFVDSSCGAEFPTLSTLSSKETKKINGVDHYVIHVEVSSASHPFYTGAKTLVDTAGRVDRFKAKMEAAKKLQEKAHVSKARKEAMNKETAEEKISRKAKENTEKKAAEKAAEKAAKEEAKKPAVKKAPAKKPAEKKPMTKKAPAKKPAKK